VLLLVLASACGFLAINQCKGKLLPLLLLLLLLLRLFSSLGSNVCCVSLICCFTNIFILYWTPPSWPIIAPSFLIGHPEGTYLLVDSFYSLYSFCSSPSPSPASFPSSSFAAFGLLLF